VFPLCFVAWFLRSRARLMRTGHRGVENWTKVVDSFTSTVDTLHNNAMKELKLFINSEIAGPGGPTKLFRGECHAFPSRLLSRIATV